MMTAAASLEDKTEKSPVTPGEVLPARELLANMLLELNKPAKALTAFEADLKTHPNRFNGLYGAALASERSDKPEKAKQYYSLLLQIANSPQASRPELATANMFLRKH